MYNLTGWNGIAQAAEDMNGRETICSALRPYGLHAGNITSIAAYPYLLFERFEREQGRDARFTYKVWLNDMEPVEYVGANGRRSSANAANMYPAGQTFQFAPAPDGFKGSLTDYWQPLIENVVRGIIAPRFPHVKLQFLRSSKLVCTPEFKRAMLSCLREPKAIVRIFERFTDLRVKGDKGFIWPICPNCEKPVPQDKIKYQDGFASGTHGFWGRCHFRRKPKHLAWGLNVRLLQTIRLAVEQPAYWVIGLDHYQTNRTWFLERLADAFCINRFKGTFLHAPLLFAGNKKKLSKSKGNAVHMEPHALIDMLRGKNGGGFNLEYAPTSKDILVIGRDLVPDYMRKDERARLAAIQKEQQAYAKSDRPIRHRTMPPMSMARVGDIMGVPHLR